jgi:uncharacterized protein YqgV (UPF0045/DUF77 family)
MDIAVEISLYPLDEQYIPPIREFIERLNTHAGLRVMTNNLSTQVYGDLDLVFDVLRKEMAATFAAVGKSIFVTKFVGPYSLLDE